MRQFEITRTLLDADVTAQVLLLDEGVQISVFGGERPHIGAVTVIDPSGRCATTEFPGHRDSAVSERWAKAIADTGFRPVAAAAGIHYDGLSRQGVADILSLTDEMLSQVLRLLKADRPSSPHTGV